MLIYCNINECRARQIQRFSVRVVAGVSGGRGVAVGAALNGTGLDALLGGDNRPVSLTNCSWMFETRGSVFYGGEYREGASRCVFLQQYSTTNADQYISIF